MHRMSNGSCLTHGHDALDSIPITSIPGSLSYGGMADVGDECCNIPDIEGPTNPMVMVSGLLRSLLGHYGKSPTFQLQIRQRRYEVEHDEHLSHVSSDIKCIWPHVSSHLFSVLVSFLSGI